MKWIDVNVELPNEYKTVLTQHVDDLFPVSAYRIAGFWQREIEGPEDIYCDQSGRHGVLYRSPTHWKELPEPPTTHNKG